jgi:hypothetical protein
MSAQPVVDRASSTSRGPTAARSPRSSTSTSSTTPRATPRPRSSTSPGDLKQAREAIRTMPPDTIGPGFLGPMRLDEFVATRLVETRVHGMDLTDALGRPRCPCRRRPRWRPSCWTRSSPGGPSPASRSWADNQRCRLGRCGGRDRVGGGCRTGARRTATPRAISQMAHRELPRKPARSKTGNPGTAVARMSPWLNRYRTLATSPAQPTQRQRMPRSTSTLMVTDQAMASSWPRCSPSSAPPNWCWAIQAAATAAWVVGSPAA